MEKFLIYQIESSICMLVLFSVWYFLMKKDTYFTLNRIVLLSMAVLSLFIPLISFNTVEPISNLPVFYIQESLISASTSTNAELAYLDILGYISVIAMFIFAIRYFIRISHILRLLPNSKRDNSNIIPLSENDNYSAFSFFKWIFIPENITHLERDIIISHEKSHINRWHYIDRTFLELVSIFMWFNPVMTIFKSELKNIHEFEADRETLENCNSKGDYFELIYKYSTGICFSDISLNFNFSNLKERITMMTKNRSSVFAYFKQALLIPAVAFLLFNFSCNDRGANSSINSIAAIEKENRKLDVVPIYRGDFKNTTFKFKYPKEAEEKGIEGSFMIAFTISEKGKVVDIKAEGSAHKSLVEEALRVAKHMKNWEPARKDGKPVSAQVLFPFEYKLE